MTLQGGIHPAQLKDAVTSKSSSIFLIGVALITIVQLPVDAQ